MKSNNQPTQPKAPRTIALVTFVQSIVITVLITAIAGIVTGFMLSNKLSTTARQSAIKDFQAVSKNAQ